MAKIKQRPWTTEERKAFAENKLRAQSIPNKKRKAAREACRRGRRGPDE
jgi:hypothetical protein